MKKMIRDGIQAEIKKAGGFKNFCDNVKKSSIESKNKKVAKCEVTEKMINDVFKETMDHLNEVSKTAMKRRLSGKAS